MVALLAQLASTVQPPAANAARAEAALAAHPEAGLAVFPELFLSGYTTEGLEAVAVAAAGPELDALRRAAERHGTAVVAGFAERLPSGRVANAAACVDRDGSLAAVYRKTHLFGDEAACFAPGDELVVCELAGRRVAPLVCFDVEFPEPARAAAQAGADLLVVVSANMAPYFADHELATRSRALENRVPLLYANAVGRAGPFRLVGGSRSVASDGTVLAELAHDREELLAAPVAAVDRSDAHVDYLAHLRAGLPVVRL